MPDAWRAYLEMALGLTEASRKKAQKVAGDLVNRGGATAAQVQGLVEDLLSTGMANREALTNIVRYEVDRALGRVGLATADEVGELTARVRDLERQLRDAQARAVAAEGGAPVAQSASLPGAGTGGTRLDQPAPVPRKVAKKAVKKAVKATPNAMPAVGTAPAAPRANTARATPESMPAKQAAPNRPETAAVVPAEPAAKKAVAKKTVAKTAAKKIAPAEPAGTAPAPTAGVKEAAAATELPPVNSPAKKAAAKRASKKAATKATPGTPDTTAGA